MAARGVYCAACVFGLGVCKVSSCSLSQCTERHYIGQFSKQFSFQCPTILTRVLRRKDKQAAKATQKVVAVESTNPNGQMGASGTVTGSSSGTAGGSNIAGGTTTGSGTATGTDATTGMLTCSLHHR